MQDTTAVAQCLTNAWQQTTGHSESVSPFHFCIPVGSENFLWNLFVISFSYLDHVAQQNIISSSKVKQLPLPFLNLYFLIKTNKINNKKTPLTVSATPEERSSFLFQQETWSKRETPQGESASQSRQKGNHKKLSIPDHNTQVNAHRNTLQGQAL